MAYRTVWIHMFVVTALVSSARLPAQGQDGVSLRSNTPDTAYAEHKFQLRDAAAAAGRRLADEPSAANAAAAQLQPTLKTDPKVTWVLIGVIAAVTVLYVLTHLWG